MATPSPIGLPLPPPSTALPPPAPLPYLSGGWRLVLASSWGLVMAALGLVANTGVILGSPPRWLSTVVLPFLLPAATLFALALDSRWSLRLSAVASIALFGVALLDLQDARGVAAAEAVLAFAALLVTVAARAGRRRR